jgi:integrase
MRLGEVLALKWGDIQFGTETDGGNRFIYVRRNWVDGQLESQGVGKSAAWTFPSSCAEPWPNCETSECSQPT